MSDKLAFHTIKKDAAPDNVQEWIRQNESKEQNKVFRQQGKTYAVILLGQKTTGGYKVEIEQIRREKTETGNNINIVTYSVTEPEKGSFNIQVLTYPMAIAGLDGEVEGEFRFVRKGEEN
ncbi:protease complex subunit PrcB family protein [Virgibacillus ihumii]|uniref:protease complex subunit PrcB family protein n=1 Tax=Virgibacillus ihumii TaxID=2686091 RepID=UPI00157D7B16|nr:protease complex subunit PrcB family protein [Virgibacillus ihumii]